MYVNDNFATYKVTASGRTLFASAGMSTPWDMTFDSSGNLYVANFGNDTVTKYNSSGALIATYFGLFGARGVEVDAAGNLFVATVSGTIFKQTPAGVRTVFASTAPGLWGLALDSQGHLFATNNNTNSISEFQSNGVLSAVVNVGAPAGIDVDSNDNVFVGSLSSPITKISSTGVVSQFASGIPQGVGSWDVAFYNAPAVAAPEPATLAMLGTGIAGLAAVRRRRAAKKKGSTS